MNLKIWKLCWVSLDVGKGGNKISRDIKLIIKSLKQDFSSKFLMGTLSFPELFKTAQNLNFGLFNCNFKIIAISCILLILGER